ncbi:MULTISPECIES: CvpA family protein [Cellulophaga]|uniref:Membrane protein required for colicin V production n=2 Tax=Cellulophaga baltica TaxID=76594 RepID=A0A1G7F6Y9_9FLAO|nr:MULTISPECIES: CvpA family protein [Cellulophaga]WFO15233.1 CvpA family protein [Cellulophaga baltica 4]AIY12421.1 colicin V production protein [Cellulophaga baltica NN016038]AIZ40780.1 colicin V production protein [Cellulophaga baltica 18]KGK31127.1 colicin V production protein [Cellulophaga sp. E6(2014)]MBA6314068.1 CvpA family protein [Cellulophaga baltica]
MNFLDIVFGLILVWGFYIGFKNGLFVEIASIIALIAGIYGAIHFSYITGTYLAENMDWNEQYMNIASFVITFIIIVVLIHLSAKLLTKIADFAMLGFLNKIAGGIFGALKVSIIIGALLLFFSSMAETTNLINEETKKESKLYEPLKAIGALIFSNILKFEPTES